MDKPEIGDLIVSDILPDISLCLKSQIESLGGVPNEKLSLKPTAQQGTRSSVKENNSGSSRKSLKKSHKVEVLQSANLFFNNLTAEQLWQWIESLVSQAIMTGAVGEGGHSKEESGRVIEREGGGSHESVRDAMDESPPNSPLSPTNSVGLFAPYAGNAGVKKEEKRNELSCSTACRLVKFLLQVLPLVCAYNTTLLSHWLTMYEFTLLY